MLRYYYRILDFDFLESSCYNPLHNKHNIHYCEHISAETDSQESQKRYKTLSLYGRILKCINIKQQIAFK